MLERTVNLKIEETYANLKANFVAKGCKVISEEPPKRFVVKQGSLWGISPTTAKKTLDAKLASTDSGTHLTCSSKLSSDWKNITLIGCVFAFVLLAVCVWMATDLTTFMASNQPSFWSWLIAVEGNVDFQAGEALVNLAWILTVFLSAIILLEIAIVAYVHSKIDTFAKKILDQLK